MGVIVFMAIGTMLLVGALGADGWGRIVQSFLAGGCFGAVIVDVLNAHLQGQALIVGEALKSLKKQDK